MKDAYKYYLGERVMIHTRLQPFFTGQVIGLTRFPFKQYVVETDQHAFGRNVFKVRPKKLTRLPLPYETMTMEIK
jgi:hypothetical protein